MPGKKAQDTKRKHGTYYGEVEYDTPVATMDISDDEVNRRMKSTTTKNITKKTTETATMRKGMAKEMRKT